MKTLKSDNQVDMTGPMGAAFVSQAKRNAGTAAAAVLQEKSIASGDTKKPAGFSPPLQRQEDEDLVQGKFSVQRQPGEDEDLVQGKFPVQRQEDEDLVQGKFPVQRQPGEEEDLVQGKFPVQRQEGASAGSSTGIPANVQSKMESSFNTDFSDVKVHANSNKATEVGALAYTQGTDIHFAPGQYSPGSSGGNRLLGHELAHVVQQSEGRVQPTGQVSGMPLNDNPALEKEADQMGAKAV